MIYKKCNALPIMSQFAYSCICVLNNTHLNSISCESGSFDRFFVTNSKRRILTVFKFFFLSNKLKSTRNHSLRIRSAKKTFTVKRLLYLYLPFCLYLEPVIKAEAKYQMLRFNFKNQKCHNLNAITITFKCYIL